MSNNGVTSAIVKSLAAELKTRVPELQAVYDDFPTPNQTLKFPCASIATGEPGFTAAPPRQIRIDEVEIGEGDPPIPEGETAPRRVVRSVGQYSFRLQLDLWSKTKFERHKLYDRIFQAFNRDSSAHGIRLQLTDYYGEWASYLITGIRIQDSEEQSQRSEWRVVVSILADVRAVSETLEYLMETIEHHVEISDNIQS